MKSSNEFRQSTNQIDDQQTKNSIPTISFAQVDRWISMKHFFGFKCYFILEKRIFHWRSKTEEEKNENKWKIFRIARKEIQKTIGRISQWSTNNWIKSNLNEFGNFHRNSFSSWWIDRSNLFFFRQIQTRKILGQLN